LRKSETIVSPTYRQVTASAETPKSECLQNKRINTAQA
jgi:hypothetical protein